MLRSSWLCVHPSKLASLQIYRIWWRWWIVTCNFNLSDTDWSDPDLSQESDSSRWISNLANTYDLKQINSVPNHRVLLNLVFTSTPTSTVTAAVDILIVEDSHNLTPSFLLCLRSTFSHKEATYILDYLKSNLDAIFCKIQDLNFLVMDSTSNLELIFNEFCGRYFSV